MNRSETGHNDWERCTECGRRFRVRWWRRLGHRYPYPIFGVIYLGRIADFVAGMPSIPDHEEYPRSRFWEECPSCKHRVVMEV